MPRPSSGANLSIDQLQRILNERRQALKRLQRQRLPIQRKLDAVDRKISQIGGSMGNGRRGGGGRMRNEVSLPAALEAELKNAGQRVPAGWCSRVRYIGRVRWRLVRTGRGRSHASSHTGGGRRRGQARRVCINTLTARNPAGRGPARTPRSFPNSTAGGWRRW